MEILELTEEVVGSVNSVPPPPDNLLSSLPGARAVEYDQGQIIYGETHPASAVFLIVDGRVETSRLASGGRRVVVDIYRTHDIFGECALLARPEINEQARSLEASKVLAWTALELEHGILAQPEIALELLRILARRAADLRRRMESLSLDTMNRRLARSLIHFADRFGPPDRDEPARLTGFTHELLARYVGTSREVITKFMNQLRREGCLWYSRDEIIVRRQALQDWLRQTK